MSFVRANPSGWASNAKLTSAQANAIDINVSNAVDKTGDSISSGLIQVTSTGEIRAAHTAAITSTFQYGIRSSIAEGIQINVDDGLVINGFTNYPKLVPTRSLVRSVGPLITSVSTAVGWSFDGFTATGPGSATAGAVFEIVAPHHGATLFSVDVVFNVGASHSSVPATLPTVDVRRSLDLGTVGVAPSASASLYSGGAVAFPTPVSAAAWFASGNLQKWTFTCDQNNVLDRTRRRYFIVLKDEGGSGALSGNAFYGFVASYVGISTMAFG